MSEIKYLIVSEAADAPLADVAAADSYTAAVAESNALVAATPTHGTVTIYECRLVRCSSGTWEPQASDPSP